MVIFLSDANLVTFWRKRSRAGLAHLVSLTIYIELEGHMIAQNDELDKTKTICDIVMCYVIIRFVAAITDVFSASVAFTLEICRFGGREWIKLQSCKNVKDSATAWTSLGKQICFLMTLKVWDPKNVEKFWHLH